jgi:hypothetical protein
MNLNVDEPDGTLCVTGYKVNSDNLMHVGLNQSFSKRATNMTSCACIKCFHDSRFFLDSNSNGAK